MRNRIHRNASVHQAAILGAAPLMRVHQSCRHSRSFNLLSLIDQATLRNRRAFFLKKSLLCTNGNH